MSKRRGAKVEVLTAQQELQACTRQYLKASSLKHIFYMVLLYGLFSQNGVTHTGRDS